MTTPFNEGDFQPWAGAGPATLHGQAFFKTVGGDVKTCAGSGVFLMPANPYGEELAAADSKGFSDANADPRALSYSRKTICEAQGDFSFTVLPAEKWYVVTTVTWKAPHIEEPGDRPGPLTSLLFGIRPPPEFDRQGGEFRKAVILQAGDNQAFLTGDDQVIVK